MDFLAKRKLPKHLLLLKIRFCQIYLFICVFIFVYLCQVYLSICGFPGKEKAAKASPASKNHILSSLFEVYLCIYIFVYLCICVKCICVFVYLCQVYLSICGFAGKGKKAEAEQLSRLCCCSRSLPVNWQHLSWVHLSKTFICENFHL